MSEMVDRCVEAAFKADWRLSKLHPADQRKLVIAVIEEMREPTLQMYCVVHSERCNGYKKSKGERALDVWQAMIDKALA